VGEDLSRVRGVGSAAGNLIVGLELFRFCDEQRSAGKGVLSALRKLTIGHELFGFCDK